MPRSELDGLISRAQELGAKGLVWAFREGDGWRSPTAKFLSETELADLNQRLGAEEGDLLLLVADKPTVVNAVLGQMRLDLAERFDLITRTVRPPALDRRLAVDGVERGGEALGPAAPSLHRARRATSTPRTQGRQGPGLRRRLERPGDGRRLDPYPATRRSRGKVFAALGIDAAESARRALASCSRRCATARRRTAASPTARPHRPAPRRRRVDPRRDRLPEDRLRLRPADRRARTGRRAPAARARRSSFERKRQPAGTLSLFDRSSPLRRGAGPGRARLRSTSPTPASTAGRRSASSPTCAPPGPGTRP